MGTWTWDLLTGRGTLDARGAVIVGLGATVVSDEPFDVAQAQRNAIHPDDLPAVESAIAEGITARGTFVLRYRATAPDGQLRHVLSNVRVDSDPQGVPVRLSGTNRDVTTEREAESTLRRMNEELVHHVRARTSEIDGLFERLTVAQDDERRRIARDIHDQLGQQMTALRMSIEMLRAHAGGETAVLAEQIEQTASLAGEVDNTIDFLAWVATACFRRFRAISLAGELDHRLVRALRHRERIPHCWCRRRSITACGGNERLSGGSRGAA